MIYAASKSGLCKQCYYKNFYIENRDTINEYYSKVYRENKEKINKKRALREKERWHYDSDFKLKKTLRSRFKKAVKEKWRSGSFIETLGCSIQELRKYLESKFQPGMSWDNYGEWEIDHIIPFHSVDLKNWSEVKHVIHYSNLQPLWKRDHEIKTNTDRREHAIRKIKS
jgi:hypothetical protein